MAHKNYGGISHTNTGYNNHTNTGAYTQSGGYAQSGYSNGHYQAYTDYHQSYHNHTNKYYQGNYYANHYNYSQCRDRSVYKAPKRSNKNKTKQNKRFSKHSQSVGTYGQYVNYKQNYSQAGGGYYNRYNNVYTQSGYANNHYQAITDYHQSYNNHTNYYNHQNYGNHTNTGGNSHSNSGYTNHVNTTTNNAPGNVSNVSRGSAVYYKDSLNLTWSAASDTPAYPIETFTPTFQNGFGNWGGTWGPVKVWRTRDKTVYIRGLVSCTQFGVIFNLPAGWRPTGGHLIFGSQEATSHCRINILNNGNVELSGSKSGGRSWINLNLCFNADSSGWKAIPLMNTWVNYSSDNGWQNARYKVTDAGVTFVEGLIRSGPNGTIVGQLPNGVGPSGRLIRHSDSTNEACRLDFLDNGQIYVDLLGGSNGHTSITSCFLSKGRTDGWVNINLQNGWTNYGNGYSVARYNKLESGEVFVEGLINSGTTTDYIQVWDVATIGPKTTNIMVAGIKAGTNKDGSFGNSEHYPDGKVAKIWNASSNWHSVVHNYIIDQPTQTQAISYYIDYCFKPIGGTWGEWTRIVSGHTSTSYNYSLAAHGNGHIKFRVLSSDGIENGSAWVESSEVRVLKYTAPSWPNPNTTATSSEVTVVKVQIDQLASAIGVAGTTGSTAYDQILRKDTITSMRNTINAAANALGLPPNTDTNLDTIKRSDIDNLKAWLDKV